jgi:hypothetical protein
MSKQLELKENEINRVVDLIHSFHSSTKFFQWLAGEDLCIDTSYEEKRGDKFERLAEYYVGGLRVFSGGGEFSLKAVSKEFSDIVERNAGEYYKLIPELMKMSKIKVSDLLYDNKYTIVSQFVNLGQVCGGCWEIYYLENLVQIYRNRKLGKEVDA